MVNVMNIILKLKRSFLFELVIEKKSVDFADDGSSVLLYVSVSETILKACLGEGGVVLAGNDIIMKKLYEN